MVVRKITTPTDFETTIGDAFHLFKWVSPPPEVEPEVRHALDNIFSDLPYMSGNEPDLLSTYLEGIVEALRTLRELGLQLVAITTRGHLVVPTGAPAPGTKIATTITRYIVAPDPCFFQLEGQRLFHRLGSHSCRESHAEIVKRTTGKEPPELRVSIYASKQALEVAYERSAPVCAVCSTGL